MRRLILPIAVLCALASARTASAQTYSCDDATHLPNPVYVLAADTQEPMLKVLGKYLRSQSTPITLVWIASGSCTNIANMYLSKFTVSGTTTVKYIPTPADVETLPDDLMNYTPPTCTLPTNSTIKPDMAISIVFPDLANCPSQGTKPADQAYFAGPVQAFLWAVPKMSSQVAITAEEAYLLAGFGPSAADVPPWNDPAFFYARPATKGTQVGIGANIGVPAGKWVVTTANQINMSGDVATAIAAQNTTGNAEKTIGILGTEIYDQDANRAALKSLAFRAFKQLRAYWPDSTPSAFDKKNVRDGHYVLWSYVQYLTKAASGVPTDPRVQLIIDLFQGKTTTTANPAIDLLADEIGNGLVPQCAMKVQRSSEGGDLSLYDPAEPCACFFEKNVESGTTSCATCDSTHPCATGTCRRGYCEAK